MADPTLHMYVLFYVSNRRDVRWAPWGPKWSPWTYLFVQAIAISHLRITGPHYNGVIMSAMAYQITSLTSVYSTIYSGADQIKRQSSASLTYVRGIHRWPVNSLHKRANNAVHFDDVIMLFTQVVQAISTSHLRIISPQYTDVIMSAMASKITSITVVYSIVYSGADQRQRQSSASLAFVRGIHRWPVNSPYKGPAMRKKIPFDDVIMLCDENPQTDARKEWPQILQNEILHGEQ